jgi:hypothetical protein
MAKFTTNAAVANKKVTTPAKVEKTSSKKVKKVKKAKIEVEDDVIVKAVSHHVNGALIEAVTSTREVKYKYPEDCNGIIERKRFRSKVRGELKKLKLELANMSKKDPVYSKIELKLKKTQERYLKAA